MHNPLDGSPILAVGAAVYRFKPEGDVELLLIRKRRGFWTLPKGQVKPGEPERTAVAREIGEETGLAGEVGDAVHTLSYEIVKGGKPRQKVVTYYLMRAESGKLRPNGKEQIEEARWFTARGALRRIQRGRVRRVARRALAILEAPQADVAASAIE